MFLDPCGKRGISPNPINKLIGSWGLPHLRKVDIDGLLHFHLRRSNHVKVEPFQTVSRYNAVLLVNDLPHGHPKVLQPIISHCDVMLFDDRLVVGLG